MSTTIAFCGIDGSGKTTQLNMLYKWLINDGYSVKQTKVNFHALKVMYHLCDKMYGDRYAYGNLPPEMSRLGIAFDFAYHYLTMQFDEQILLCDRHKVCFRAYGTAYGLTEPVWVDRVLDLVNDPDIILYFDTDTNISNKRLRIRTERPIRSDETLEHLELVKTAYSDILENQKNVFVINSNCEKEIIFENIKNIIINNVLHTICQYI